MLQFLETLLSSDSLSPHGICLLWRPELVWAHVISDALIAAAYYSIPVALAYFVMKRPDVAFGWVFWAFAIFILACGTTHVLSIWTLWRPDYGAEALVKAVTAVASVLTAIGLLPLVPKALALPSPEMLRRANAALTRQIRERDAAHEALRRETEERLKAEALLRQAQKMEAIGQLTGGVAHDFNNLLTVVIGNLERAERRIQPTDSDLRGAVQRALAGAERAATLTHQLLAYARRQPLLPAVVDLNALVGQTVELLHRSLGEAVAIETALAPGLRRTRIDPGQLSSALLNLAVNARDAMPKGGTLRISTRNLAPAETAEAAPDLGPVACVLIEVGDSGAGMPPEVLEHAFEPFYTTKPLGQGSGLGLSQVYGFVKQSNGHVALDSVPGRGTRVHLYLPAAEADPADGTAEPGAARLRPCYHGAAE